MGLIPTYCDACERSRLLDETVVGTGAFSCSICAGQARSVPGSSYAEADAPLYDQLASIVREAGISVANAAQLQAQLRGENDEPADRLLKLARALPTFAGLEQLAAAEPAVARKAEAMLRTILDGIASRHTRSGLMPAILGVSARQRRSFKR